MQIVHPCLYVAGTHVLSYVQWFGAHASVPVLYTLDLELGQV